MCGLKSFLAIIFIFTVSPSIGTNVKNTQNENNKAEEIVGAVNLNTSDEEIDDGNLLQIRDRAHLSMVKNKIENRVRVAQTKVNKSKSLTNEGKLYKHKILQMFLEELKESETDMMEAEKAFKQALSMDFWNTSSLKENSKKRLDNLRLATLKEERSYQRMQKFSMDLQHLIDFANESSWVNEILKEISNAADQLESVIAEPDFYQADGARIEAVFHYRDIRERQMNVAPSNEQYDDNLDVLIDSKQNKYVLSKQKDSMSPLVDHALVIELIYVLLLSVPFGYLCQLINVPSLFGCIFTGLLLGPSGINAVQEMVQIETIGEMGVFYIMFAAGLEFSIVRIRKVWRVAIQCPVYVTILMVIIGVLIGSSNNVPMGESAFVSACLSFSSTPLVTRFVGSIGDAGHTNEYASLLIGILITQDLQLSLLMAVMPSLAVHKLKESIGETIFHMLLVFMKTSGCILLVVVTMVFIARNVLPYYFKFLSTQPRELQLLGTLAVMFVTQVFTSNLSVSMELGCFVAGAVVSHAVNHPMNAQAKGLMNIEAAILAVHDVFSSLFFVSIGLHIFPSFVLTEFRLLISLTFLVIAGKFCMSLLVLKLVMPPQSQKLKWIVSSGLAQVSEFSFVLGSRARHLKIISREVFLLILSVTTLSLLVAPLLWKLSLWRFNKHNHSSVC